MELPETVFERQGMGHVLRICNSEEYDGFSHSFLLDALPISGFPHGLQSSHT
jgi:hypothetical protein